MDEHRTPSSGAEHASTAEDSPYYAFDPAQVSKRRRWRVAVEVVAGLGLASRWLLLPLTLYVVISSLPPVFEILSTAMATAMGGSADVPAPPSLWVLLVDSGLVRTAALMLGVGAVRTVLVVLRSALGDTPPGGVLLAGDDERRRIVRTARGSAIAARAAIASVRSGELRCRLEHDVAVVDATTWAMADAMTSESPDIVGELRLRCRSVEEVARSVQAVVTAEVEMDLAVPTVPPTPAPDAATLLWTNDVALQAARDHVMALVGGMKDVTALSPARTAERASGGEDAGMAVSSPPSDEPHHGGTKG